MPILSSTSLEFSETWVQHPKALDTVVFYDTMAAAKRGLSTLARIIGIMEDDGIEIRPKPWKLGLLCDPSVSESVKDDILAAHVILLSTSGNAPLSLPFKIWLASILIQKRGEHAAVVALLGLNERSAQAASSDLHFIQQLALEAKLDFFSPNFNHQYSICTACKKNTAVEVGF